MLAHFNIAIERNTYVLLAEHVILISNRISMKEGTKLVINMGILSLPIIFIHLETEWLRDLGSILGCLA